MIFRYKKLILCLFLLFAAITGYYTTKLHFTFSFDQFFPKDDEDYQFYQSFIKDFETDDNFLLIGLPNKAGVFDSVYLKKVDQATTDISSLAHVRQVRSLTHLTNPVKTPFGFMPVPVLHVDEPTRYAEDSVQIMGDKRWLHNLINEKGDALCIILKTEDNLGLAPSQTLIKSLDSLLTSHELNERHYLGRAFFQSELVHFQTDEIRKSTIISGILITIFLWFLFRRPMPVFITLSTVGLGLMVFMGLLAMMGQQLTALSALFPVLMLIVGSSDVIHIYSKYTDEVSRQSDHYEAMKTTLWQIGIATLITSLTTALGFASLSTSKLESIREFGLQSALGVLIAYVVVLAYMVPMLLIFPDSGKAKHNGMNLFWDKILAKIYHITFTRSKMILQVSVFFLVVVVAGIFFIKTNYSITDNLPHRSKVRNDFLYFEQNFGGFRPLEYAISIKADSLAANDYRIVKDINAIEEKLLSYPFVKTSVSQAGIYKSISKSYHNNTNEFYTFPEDSVTFATYQGLMSRMKIPEQKILISEDGQKTRISARIRDIGADKIKAFGEEMDDWIAQNTDTSLVDIRRTGTGFIMDKNSEYVKENLIQGLSISLILISLLMSFMLKSMRMLFIALIPNIFPLLVAAAILGYFGIDLEAGISIVFAIIFGIAVDDTIHFLAKYTLCLRQGLSKEEAIQKTIMETGKAIIFTTLVLSLGFLVMVFSQNPPTYTIGILISVTLISALICDLFLLPVLLRKWHNK